MKKKIMPAILCLLVIVIATIGVMVFSINSKNKVVINSFEECAVAGYPIMESYPEQCKTPDGKVFIRTIDLARPQFGEVIPLSLFAPYIKFVFNDGLTVTLKEINDSRCRPGMVCVWAGELSPKFNITGGDIGKRLEEFSLGTTTKKSASINGYTFTLQDATVNSAEIIVTKQSSQQDIKCYVGGCSMQICSDKQDVVTTCEYRKDYACYKDATCEKQANGQCGWTQTDKLKTCLSAR